jgi:hypothetical protein
MKEVCAMRTMNPTQIDFSQLETGSQERLSLVEGAEYTALGSDSNTVTSVIPYEPRLPDLKQSHAQFFVEQIRKGRDLALSEIRCLSGVPSVVKSLNRKTLYRAVVPKGGILQKGKDGYWRGVKYGDKGIKKHAKFVEVKPGAMEIFKTVGSQVILISISMQLNRIEEMIQEIFGEFHRDRIAEIHSGARQFETAILMDHRENRVHTIHHAVQSLDRGLEKTMAELRHLIAKSPEARNSFICHLAPWHNKVNTAGKVMGFAAESFGACLLGIKTLAECYAALEERHASLKMLRDLFSRLMDCDIRSAAEKARLIDARSMSVLPAVPWRNFLERYPSLTKKLQTFEGTDNGDSRTMVQVEFYPSEILRRSK